MTITQAQLRRHFRFDVDVPDEEIGIYIRRVRMQLGVSRGVLAQRAGVTTSYICMIENGKRNSWPTIASLLVLLGVRVWVDSQEVTREGTPPG